MIILCAAVSYRKTADFKYEINYKIPRKALSIKWHSTMVESRIKLVTDEERYNYFKYSSDQNSIRSK